MIITVFENRSVEPMTLIIDPGGDQYEVPHLAQIGIRYALPEGKEHRAFTSVGENRVEFWCDAQSHEVDIVEATPGEKLSWEICVGGGWCGGIVDGQPTHVEKLVPRTGQISSEAFASLAVRAEGWPEGEAMPDKHLTWLAAKFEAHFGASAIDAEEFHRRSRRPFDPV